MSFPLITKGTDAENLPWKSLKMEGCYVKSLGRHPETNGNGGYFKMEPHSFASVHSHPSHEFALVLEGEVELDGETYGPGSFFHRPAGLAHGPHTTGEKGVLMFACFAGLSGSEAVLGMVTEEEE